MVLALLALVASACEQSPLLAPTGSTIILTAPMNALANTGSVEILAQVLEPAGTPPHSGTLVTFTTTLGVITPATAETDASGRAVARFQANGANGTATITATSGGAATTATGALRIAVGSAAVGAVRVGANPASVSALGGSTTITASVLDVNGNALTQVPVAFTTTAGTLSSQSVMTDVNGNAQTILTTAQQATVTANVGAQGGSSSPPTTSTGGTGGTTTTPTTPPPASTGQASGSVTITVNAQATLVITPPTTAPSAGLPSTYTFAVTVPTTNGIPVRNLRVSWGDGTSQDLGAVSGNASVQHTYDDTGTYTITGTLTDAVGNVQTVSTAVSVIPVPAPTINITPSVPASCTGAGACTVTFLLQVTPPTGVGIRDVTVFFGPSATPPQQGLGGLTGSATLSARYPAGAGVQTIIVTVLDTLGHTTQGFTTINIP
jgi:adhesin/invasin